LPSALIAPAVAPLARFELATRSHKDWPLGHWAIALARPVRPNNKKPDLSALILGLRAFVRPKMPKNVIENGHKQPTGQRSSGQLLLAKHSLSLTHSN